VSTARTELGSLVIFYSEQMPLGSHCPPRIVFTAIESFFLLEVRLLYDHASFTRVSIKV
jgi:hypothetical protein